MALDPRRVIKPFPKPGLFITATSTDTGKTTVTAALAGALTRLGARVGVCKPIASGCPKYPDRGNHGPLADDDLIPKDSLICLRAAGLFVENHADETLLRHAAPVRYAAPLSPHLAARIEGRPPAWERVAAAFDYWQDGCDVLLVEGAGGWLVPLDDSGFTIESMAAALGLPVIVVTGVYLGSLNHAELTVRAIRAKQVPVAGLVANDVPVARDITTQLNLQELPKLCQAPLLATLPHWPTPITEEVPSDLVAPLVPFARHWLKPV